MDVLAGWPLPAAMLALFGIVMVRANATYWLGRGARSGAARTRARRLFARPAYRRAESLINRWGAPVVTVSFLTVGFQTLVNLAAGAARMPLRRYLPAVTAGSVVWALVYATVGFVTWEAFTALYRISPPAFAAAVGGLAVVILILVIRAATGRTSPEADADRP